MKLSKEANAILGNNLRSIRKEMGLSQDAVAEMAGVTTTYFAQIELGQKSPCLETLVRIAQKMPTSIDRIVFGDQANTMQANLMRMTNGMTNQQMDGLLKIVSTIRKDFM